MKTYQRKIHVSLLFITAVVALLITGVWVSKNRETPDTQQPSISESEEIQSQDYAFETYIDELFCQEISASALSLHYTLEHPENYGITEYNTVLGVYSAENVLISAALSENIASSLEEFDRDALSDENRLTLDLLLETTTNNRNAASFPYYAEPLRPSTGEQAELPILLAEYTFGDTQDVADYLEILASVPAYFESICTYEQEKYAQGLFMSDFAAEAVINQCEDFAASAENNYLLYTFEDKIDALAALSENEMTAFKKQNQAIVTDEILPAYEKIAQTLSSLRQADNNRDSADVSDSTNSADASAYLVDTDSDSKTNAANGNGLCQLPLGKAYYESLVHAYTGSDDTIETLQSRTETQRTADLSAAADLLDSKPELADQWANPTSEILSASPEEMLAHLQEAIQADFPAINDCSYTVKYVDEAMEAYLSPAFYLTSPLDAFTENAIYINGGSGYEGLKLFTTLAHEGYPGHLYQNAAFCQTGASPIRVLLGPAGYTEGWATYVEMISYQYAGLSDDLATLLALEQSAILSLYASADMGIHYDGWDFAQTLDFFSAYGYSDEQTIREIFELIVEEPANYLKYYIGYLEFLTLKDYAREALGDAYEEQKFHQTILEIGPVTFPLLKEYFLSFYSD